MKTMKVHFTGVITVLLVISMKAQPVHPSAEKTTHTSSTVSAPNQTALPKPFATKSAYNFSTVLGWTGNATPKAPEGFKVSRFGTELKNPRSIYVLPNGDVLIAEAKKEHTGLVKVGFKLVGASAAESKFDNANRITIIRDANHDGVPELQQVFLQDKELPFGMVLVKDFLYVAYTNGVWRYPYKEGQTSITVPGEQINTLPTLGRHWVKNIIANKQGTKLYIAGGSASNIGEKGMDQEYRRACILECDLDGNNERIYASGLRNPVGMDWAPGTNVLWTAVNERDELGDDLVPDYLTSVQENGFYGWPYAYYGKNVEPRIKEKNRRPDLVEKTITPDVNLGSHTASLGLKFNEKNMFPEHYKGGAFVGQRGSWNRAVPSGYKVVYVPFKNGKAGIPEDFLTGFMADLNTNKVYGRPVGVAQMNDGSLLVADDAGNSVWRITYGK